MFLSEIIYLAGFAAMTAVRIYHVAKHRDRDVTEQYTSTVDRALLGLVGLGMLLPLPVIFTSWLAFADYSLSGWLIIPGSVLYLLAIWLLHRSHRDLGDSWDPGVALHQDHKLITSGVYRYFRHPMYMAHLLWAMAQAMLIPNWIGSFSLLATIIPFLLYRVPREERMLQDRFGKAYTEKTKPNKKGPIDVFDNKHSANSHLQK